MLNGHTDAEHPVRRFISNLFRVTWRRATFWGAVGPLPSLLLPPGPTVAVSCGAARYKLQTSNYKRCHGGRHQAQVEVGPGHGYVSVTPPVVSPWSRWNRLTGWGPLARERPLSSSRVQFRVVREEWALRRDTCSGTRTEHRCY